MTRIKKGLTTCIADIERTGAKIPDKQAIFARSFELQNGPAKMEKPAADVQAVDEQLEAVRAMLPATDVSQATNAAAPVKAGAKIEDFGEKLAGARKDYAALLKDAQAVDVATAPLSKSWPEPDYQKLLDGGADPFMVAFIHAARDEVPTKPQSSWKLKGWTEAANSLRGLAQSMLDGGVSKDKIQEALSKDQFRNVRKSVGSRAELYELVGHAQSLKGVSFDEHHYSLYRGQENVRKWVVEQKAKATAFSNWPRELAVADTKAEMLAQFKAKMAAAPEAAAKANMSFVIWRQDGKYSVGKKLGSNYVALKSFDDVKAARAYLADHAAELEAALERYKSTPFERNAENAPRVGADHRSGAGATPEAFADAFKFRGVQFGNYVEQSKRQSDLDRAFDSLMDLSGVLGLPSRALSLNGQLGLAFGARGHGGKDAAAAHYEPDEVVTNLTKERGAGSLAHEWFHGADNYFAKLDGGKGGMMTEGAVNPAVRPEMVEAFKGIQKAIAASEMRKRSRELDKRKAKPYWATHDEMAARAFEAYIIAKLQDQGAANDYLANIVSEDYWKAQDALMGHEGEATYPYPTPAEMGPIREAFDKFFQTVETRQDDAGNVAMFSLEPTSAEANALRALSDTDEMFALAKSRALTIESIAADIDPAIKVEAHPAPGMDRYTLTMPNGDRAGIFVREQSPYGPHRYGKAADHLPDELVRPGEDDWNMRDVDDVWIDVSKLKAGGGGAKVYAVAGDFAHNTGRVFIGDPTDVSAAAMARRPEAMLSSALRWGTTEHLAPHPKQIVGNKTLDIPPLKWVAGDDLANIRRLIDLNLKALDNATNASDRLTFDPATGRFRDGTGAEVQIARGASAGGRMGGYPRVARALAGSRTLARAAVWRALLREGGREGEAGGRRDGLLARLARLANDRPQALAGLFKLGQRESTGLTVTGVQRAVDELTKGWKNAPKIIVVQDMRDAPPETQATLRRMIGDGATGTPKGFFHGGKVYLVADELPRASDVARVVFHETLGHAGLRGFFGPELDKVLRQMAAMMPDRVLAKAKSYGLADKETGAYKSEAAKLLAAEEVLAEIAQERPSSTWVQKAIAAIKQWLRDNIPALADLKLTDADVIAMFIEPARRFVEEGVRKERGDEASAVPAFDLSVKPTKTDSAEFKRWFADSKVVDAQGKPLVVYHGTDADFDTFALQEDSPRPGHRFGFYFTPKQDFAGKYGAAKAVYLSVKNPKVVSADEFQAMQGKKGGERERRWAIEEGHDGATTEDGKVWVAFRPEQIKSATGNSGAFDPDSADIRFSLSNHTPEQREASGKPPNPPKQGRLPLSHEPGWAMPDGTRFDDLVYKLQDKHIDLKRALGAIKQAAVDVADRFDAYLQEELFHGRAAKRTEDFAHHELEPLLRDMKLRELSIDAVGAYLHARHAKEANAHIAEINPDLPDGGSGMTDAEAQAYLDGLDQAVKKRLEAVAARVDAILAKTRGLYVAYGLESQATVDGWAAMFEHYVPLMREDKDAGMGIGQGFSIKGREVKHRTGSTATVIDILANIAAQRERVIVRGEKNRVAVALAGLVKTNPNPDVWTFGEVPTEQVLNEQSGMVETRQKPGFKNDPNVLMAKIVGKDGNVHERAVVFNAKDARALRMATALKNLDAAQLEGALGVSAKITRYFSAINTQYNPVFGVVNLTRDVGSAALNLTSTELAGHRAEILGHTLSALSGIYRDARAVRNDKLGTSNWAALWEEFQNEGGQTGFRDLYRTSEDRAKALQAVMDPTAWMQTGWGRFFTAGGALKVPLTIAQKGATPLFDWLSDYNQAMENATRLAAYKVGLEQGMSKQRAASLAKNLTVNFNRKGQKGMEAGALFAFFNASMQGTARMAEVLFDMQDGKINTLRVSKAGATIIAGGLLLGVAQAVALAAAGFDDDEPPQFVRERNLIIPLKAAGIDGKKYITIPMPLGWHVIPNLGRIGAELTLSGFKNPGKRAAQVLGLVAEAFNPLGSAGVSLQTISPTALDPLVALAENRDWTGKPIAKHAFDRTTPGHQLARDTASTPARWLSKAINRLSGGTEHVAGAMSPTPDQIDYLWGQATGGVGRELNKAEQSVRATISGEDLPPHKIPLIGRFYGNADSASGQANRFYENVNRLNEHEAQLKGLRKDGMDAEAEAYELAHPEADEIRYANRVEARVRKLRREKSELIKEGAPRKAIIELEREITEAMKELNETIEQANKPKKKAA